MTQAAYEALVYRVVAQIPSGRVATYGQVAFLTGFANRARGVGKALRYAPMENSLPCHRVVNSKGRTVPGWEEQKVLLLQEGVPFRPNGSVDLAHCRWQP